MSQASLANLKGIGKKKQAYFGQLGITTLADLIDYIPRDYEFCETVTPLSGIAQTGKYTLLVDVEHMTKNRLRGGRTMHKYTVADQTGSATVIFINAPYINNFFNVSNRYYLYGTIKVERGQLTVFHPDIRQVEQGGFGIVPKYGLTDGLNQRDVRDALTQVQTIIDQLAEDLPTSIVEKHSLMSRSQTLHTLHAPVDRAQLSDATARYKYAELFHMQMALMHNKHQNTRRRRQTVYTLPTEAAIRQLFPFDLTADQWRAIADIMTDFHKSSPMNRLLQGDVGSGKTAVAAAAAFIVICNRHQVAMMVPTELLAKQHYQTLSTLLPTASVELLVSSVKDKASLYQRIASGEVDFVIGTHAVIQTQVEFNQLGLVITDEQHRFGVKQRQTLSKKSQYTDVLVMSATPIPRTLSLIVYGDMDISQIKEMPKGRKRIKTHYVKPAKVDAMHSFIGEHLDSGERAYFVAPLIAESDAIDLVPAETLYRELVTRYPTHRVALLHGQMKAAEKAGVMQAFASGEVNVLVATTVIEVGVDVPQATIMVITHAERFGLAQLHQLRGRVGRGDCQSYCFLLSARPGSVARARIKMLINSQDGFAIAEEDLSIRGPGELLGLKQHGLPELKLANLVDDYALVQTVQADVKQLYQEQAVPDDYLQWLNGKMTL